MTASPTTLPLAKLLNAVMVQTEPQRGVLAARTARGHGGDSPAGVGGPGTSSDLWSEDHGARGGG